MACNNESVPQSVIVAEQIRSQQDVQSEMEFCCGEDYEADLKLLSRRCLKNPGHTDFIPIEEFTPEKLSDLQQDLYPGVMDMVVRTVRIRIFSKVVTKSGQPKILSFGSGFLDEVNGLEFGEISCPLDACPVSSSPHKVIGPISITTALHVVQNDDQAKSAQIEFFYDDPNDELGVVTGHGIYVLAFPLLDTASLKCVIHDLEFPKKLKERKEDLLKDYEHLDNQDNESDPIQQSLKLASGGVKSVFCVSHPHGLSKHVTLGEVGVGNPVLNEVTSKLLKSEPGASDLKQNNQTTLNTGNFGALLLKLSMDIMQIEGMTIAYEKDDLVQVIDDGKSSCVAAASATPQIESRMLDTENNTTSEMPTTNITEYKGGKSVDKKSSCLETNKTATKFPAEEKGDNSADNIFSAKTQTKATNPSEEQNFNRTFTDWLAQTKETLKSTLSAAQLLSINTDSKSLVQDTDFLEKAPHLSKTLIETLPDTRLHSNEDIDVPGKDFVSEVFTRTEEQSKSVSYNVATCAGSSGAPVFFWNPLRVKGDESCSVLVHSRSRKSDGINLSLLVRTLKPLTFTNEVKEQTTADIELD